MSGRADLPFVEIRGVELRELFDRAARGFPSPTDRISGLPHPPAKNIYARRSYWTVRLIVLVALIVPEVAVIVTV
jgi:hypothetical protein